MDSFGLAHGTMWIVWLLFLVGIVLVVLYLVRGPSSGGWGEGQGRPGPTAREILDQRYASGEITKEQYEEMKRTLER